MALAITVSNIETHVVFNMLPRWLLHTKARVGLFSQRCFLLEALACVAVPSRSTAKTLPSCIFVFVFGVLLLLLVLVLVLVFLRPDGRVVVEAVVGAAPVATRR